VEHLEGRRSLRETRELVQSKTRQFARRQRTWMTGQLDLEWLMVERAESPDQTAARIASRLTVD